MLKSIFFALCCLFPMTVPATAQETTFFRAIAGNWEGELEYQDYSRDKRVKLKAYLFVTPAADGRSAEFFTVYDDFGRIVKSRQTYRLDAARGEFLMGEYAYRIDAQEAGRIVLAGSGQDGERIEPIRQTITYGENALEFLKETRAPWQFRNRSAFRRTSENVLAPKTFAPAALKEDLAALKKTLLAIHPGIYRYQTKESLEKIFAAAAARLDAPLSEGEFFVLVARLVNQIYCGHTYLNPYNQKSLLRERLFGGRTYLPFYFRIVDGRLIVTENASERNLARGSEILSIDGVPVRKIIETLSSVTKGDGRNTPENRLQSLELTRFEAERYALFDWYYPLFFPLAGDGFAIEAVDFGSKKKTRLTVRALTKEERTAEMAKRYGPPPTYDDGWKFEIAEDGTAYLKIANSITWRLKKIKYKEFLAAAFAEMRARQVKNLIVDLRGNDGGDTGIGLELARYLARTNLPNYIESRRLVRNVAAQPDLLKNLDTYSDELKSLLKNGLSPDAYRKAEGEYYQILPGPAVTSYPPVVPFANNFTGRTYMISDAANASAAFQFLNYVRTHRLATIVGQPTGGSRQGINGGNYFFLYLPNSQLEIDIPVYFLAPPTTEKDEGVVPDIAVRRRPADIGGGFDRELDAIRNKIRR